MRTCEEILDLISLRLDGELTPEQELALEEHLASCPACRALADDLAGIHSVMPGMNVPTPAYIMEHVMERIKGEEAAVIPFPVKKNRKLQWRSWAGVAAALVLVAGGAFVLWGGNATTGGEAMTLAAGMQEPSAAPSAYRAAVEGGERKESVVSLPTPEPSTAPSCAPAESTEPAAEPNAQNYGGSGEDKTADDAKKPDMPPAPAATDPPQVRTYMMPKSQPDPSVTSSVTPSLTPTPTPDHRQQMVGLEITPAVMPLTPAEAAKKLYEEKYTETHTGAVFTEQEDDIGYMAPDWSLKYMGETQDGTAYEFKEAYFEGETETVQARYLVPLDGSEIQLLDSEAVE